jgi:hypothetical protein
MTVEPCSRWSRAAEVVVDAGGARVGVDEPFLHLRNVGALVKRIGGGRRAGDMVAESFDGDADALRGVLEGSLGA